MADEIQKPGVVSTAFSSVTGAVKGLFTGGVTGAAIGGVIGTAVGALLGTSQTGTAIASEGAGFVPGATNLGYSTLSATGGSTIAAGATMGGVTGVAAGAIAGAEIGTLAGAAAGFLDARDNGNSEVARTQEQQFAYAQGLMAGATAAKVEESTKYRDLVNKQRQAVQIPTVSA